MTDTTKLIEEAKALMAKEPPLCWSKDYIRLLPELASALAERKAGRP